LELWRRHCPHAAIESSLLQRLEGYKDLARNEFDKIDRLAYSRSFDHCLELAKDVLRD